METTDFVIPEGSRPLHRELAGSGRSKTAQRLKYEAEIEVLKREMGGLEDLRIRLGFSRRKICQILMVDPSAWTRWTSDGGDAPPHIYQALRWYLDSKTAQTQKFESYWEELKAENRTLHDELLSLRQQFRKLRTICIAGVFGLSAFVSGIFLWKAAFELAEKLF